jgi:hypothetical protein
VPEDDLEDYIVSWPLKVPKTARRNAAPGKNRRVGKGG